MVSTTIVSESTRRRLPIKFDWQQEVAYCGDRHIPRWEHIGTNCVRDFHGDPSTADITVLSDGNHFMALQAALQAYLEFDSGVHSLFYVTLPPGGLSKIIEHNAIQIGNLTLSIRPDYLIGPDFYTNNWYQKSVIDQPQPLMTNRGSALLVSKHSKKNICALDDLLRDDITLFISNPINESVSYRNYRDTLLNLCKANELDSVALHNRLESGGENICFGEMIHHREAPLALINGRCDVAILYHHLAHYYSTAYAQHFYYLPLSNNITQPVNLTTTNCLARFNESEKNNSTVDSFTEFMFGQRVREIYTRFELDPAEG